MKKSEKYITEYQHFHSSCIHNSPKLW